ncbi:30S ribosomal protein S2 [Mycoplasma sp. SG1]|uniref:30S ribosomal protein S2 n=1 Tax=Mycoplasma sp. SG1 TaxID=2810348 RepID=UPI00202459DB|nr:30S ribosomal protein S2 [Mycoplasma sp. SG1]URM53234.1 30S ribosomal protein S2 [Mycoplasma sp. SG1]
MEENRAKSKTYYNKINEKNFFVAAKLLLKSGVQFGHRKNLCHPQFKKYVFLSRNKINIINLEKTIKYLSLVYNYVYEQVKANKTILFVGLKKQFQDIVKQEAERANVFYLNKCWKGGTFTNFKIISKQIQESIALEKNIANNLVGKDLTKKELRKLKNKVTKFNSQFEGIKEMKTIPSMVFLCSPILEKVIIKECKIVGSTVIGIADTNFNPRKLDFFIPANDDGVKSIKLILGVIADAVCKAKGLPTAVINRPNIDILFNQENKMFEFQEVDSSLESQNSPNYFFSTQEKTPSSPRPRTPRPQYNKYDLNPKQRGRNWRNNQNATAIFDLKDKDVPIDEFNKVITMQKTKKKSSSKTTSHSYSRYRRQSYQQNKPEKTTTPQTAKDTSNQSSKSENISKPKENADTLTK